MTVEQRATRTCRRCLETKDLERDFGKWQRDPQGRQIYCKACVNGYARKVRSGELRGKTRRDYRAPIGPHVDQARVFRIERAVRVATERLERVQMARVVRVLRRHRREACQ